MKYQTIATFLFKSGNCCDVEANLNDIKRGNPVRLGFGWYPDIPSEEDERELELCMPLVYCRLDMLKGQFQCLPAVDCNLYEFKREPDGRLISSEEADCPADPRTKKPPFIATR
jgi:hypothetical protein